MRRIHQTVLVVATLVASWLGMQGVHECGHVLGARLSGGEVARVVLHPLVVSRTDLARNPHPGAVVWTGPVAGVLLPLALLGAWLALRLPGAFLARFFAGFCLVANGAYVGVGLLSRAGDADVMLRHGAVPWQLVGFGALALCGGLFLWHGQGSHFGLGAAGGRVSRRAAYASLALCLALVAFGLWVDGTLAGRPSGAPRPWRDCTHLSF